MLLRGAGLAVDGDDGDEEDPGQEAFLLALGESPVTCLAFAWLQDAAHGLKCSFHRLWFRGTALRYTLAHLLQQGVRRLFDTGLGLVEPRRLTALTTLVLVPRDAGGFGRRGRGAAATGTGTAATDGTGRLTRDTTVDGAAAATGTATCTTDGGGGGKSRATDGGYNAHANATTMLMFEMPTDLFGVPGAGEGTQEELQQRLRRRRQQQQKRKQDLADDGTFLDNDEDEEEEDGDEQQQQQQQRSTSVVSLPLPSVGLPPEHDMPPSPLAEGEWNCLWVKG